MTRPSATSSLRIHGSTTGLESVLTPPALAFLEDLARRFSPRIATLLQRRVDMQAEYDAGLLPRFSPETESIRESTWTVAPIPADLRDRRVEITGPVDAKMIINALNSGANVFMADCEDSCAPTWANEAFGQLHLMHAVRRTLTWRDEAKAK